MKKIVLFILLAVFTLSLSAAPKKKDGAKVDERVELLSIVFRLAGNREYSFKEDKNSYIDNIEKWFEPYKEDTLIRFAKILREKTGMGYDAVAMMSVSLEGKAGNYSLPKETSALIEKDNTGRWNQWNAPAFVKLLNDFYHKTNFDKFFKQHKKWYEAMEKRFDDRVGFNRDWYSKFYRETGDSDYQIILGCSNGYSNYGPRTFDESGRKTAYAILGCWGFGDDGLAGFGKESGHLSILIHEFNHSFVNPMLEKADAGKRLSEAGEKIMPPVKEAMASQAYQDFETVLKESVVRAAVIRYMRENGASQEEIKGELNSQRALSYYWIDGLDSLLGVYSANREKYPTFSSFYPQIEEFFNKVAENINSMHANHLAHTPKILSISPDIRDKNDVDPSTKELKVVFDRDILTDVKGAVGIQTLRGGNDAISGIKESGKNFKTYTLNLKPDTGYEFRVIGFVPATEDGYYVERVYIKFRTSK